MSTNSLADLKPETDTDKLLAQISRQQLTIRRLQDELRHQDEVVERLNNERRSLQNESRKLRRYNVDLRQQLEDERTFYNAEKEHFCEELTKNNKGKRLSSKNKSFSLQVELDETKGTLEKAVTANHKLHESLLRTKERVRCLKNVLKRCKKDFASFNENVRSKLGKIEKEINAVRDTASGPEISVSNRKFVEVVSRNYKLTHENCELRHFTEELKLMLDEVKLHCLRSNKEKYSLKPDRRNEVPLLGENKTPTNVDKVVKLELQISVDELKAAIENQCESLIIPGAQSTIQVVIQSKEDLMVNNVYENRKCKSETVTKIKEECYVDQVTDEKYDECEVMRIQSAPEVLQTSDFCPDKNAVSVKDVSVDTSFCI